MTKTELKSLEKAIKNQIRDIRELKKEHLRQARICTFNIARLQERLRELQKEIKK